MGDDLDPEVEVGRETSDDGELLEVLLPEHGDGGPDRREQLGHHRRHPVEMAGTGGTLHRRCEVADRHRGPERRAVHGRCGRCVDRVDTELATQGDVGVDRAGVPVEVVRPVELERVDEDRHDGDIGDRLGVFDEFDVSPVEGAHRRHEADRSPLPVPVARPRAHVGRGDDGGEPIVVHAGLADGQRSK